MRFYEVFMRSQIIITSLHIDVYEDFYEVLGLLRKFFWFYETWMDVITNT